MKLPKRMELNGQQLDELIERVASSGIAEEDLKAITAMAESLKLLRSAVQEKTMSIKRLLRMLFGAPTESSNKVLKKPSDGAAHPGGTSKRGAEKKPKAKGHGRNGAADYSGATRVEVPHQSLKRGARCPQCPKGKVYPLSMPAMVLCLAGAAPVQGSVYELERLRCNLCGTVFTAEPPPECSATKYDESVGSIIAVLKYGGGFPFYRLEHLQDGFGIPLPASTQWELVNAQAQRIQPVYEELVRQAAQGTVVHTDDTRAKILSFLSANQALADQESSRTGLFTTGILSHLEQHSIALYFTGRNHAGENLGELLPQRDAERGPPIQMCDALSRNLPTDFKVILANCLCHARRKFVDLTEIFPEESGLVITSLKQVYEQEAIAKQRQMSEQQRLVYHQAHSAAVMKELHRWLTEQGDTRRVEPNSSLGQAIAYMLKHWEALTLFLRVPGAPLDNNLCEQVLKRAILHRKNSLFFKTQRGADVGDLFMSLIHTCRLNRVNPFAYLTALANHATALGEHPQRWLPWNHEPTLS